MITNLPSSQALDGNTMAVLLSIGVAVLLFLLLLHRRRNLPPGPCGWPVVGSLFNIGRPLHRHFAKLSSKYGPILYLQMGSRPTVVISNARLAKEVLRDHDAEFASRPSYSTVFRHISGDFSDLVFAPYGDHWRQMRRICSKELFTCSKVNLFAAARKTEMNEFGAEIERFASMGELINLTVLFQHLVTNLMSSVLFGKRFYSFNMPSGAEAQAYRDTWGMLAQESGKLYIGDYVPALRWIDRLKNRDHRMKTKVMPAIKQLLATVVAERRNKQGGSKGPKDFAEVMLSLSHLSEDNIVAILQDMILAGTGTSRATLEWGFTELMRHPEVLRKAQEQIDAVVGKNRPVEESDLKNLPYIHALVKEIMRLHPAAPLGIPHCNARAVNLAGYTIPPKSTLHVNIWAICRDPEAWQNPHDFNPERFLGTDHSVWGRHFDLIPFSSGRRRCIGIQLALVHLTLALAYLIHRFDWRLPAGLNPDEIDMSETTGIASLRKNPLLLAASPRLVTSRRLEP